MRAKEEPLYVSLSSSFAVLNPFFDFWLAKQHCIIARQHNRAKTLKWRESQSSFAVLNIEKEIGVLVS
jgi:hypothetical protein